MNKITTQKQAIARYGELVDYHLDAISSGDQREKNKIRGWEREQAELEREFPGTLDAWIEQI